MHILPLHPGAPKALAVRGRRVFPLRPVIVLNLLVLLAEVIERIAAVFCCAILLGHNDRCHQQLVPQWIILVGPTAAIAALLARVAAALLPVTSKCKQNDAHS
jgi:hypothetical protein